MQKIWTKFKNTTLAAAARQIYERLAPKPAFRAALQADGTLELLVYEEIGELSWDAGVTAAAIKAQVDAAAGKYSKILIRINSPGGDAFEGIAIHNLIRSAKKPVEVHVDGVAASAASIIAMAGDTITMSAGAMLMVHNAWGYARGYAEDLEAMAGTLRKVSSAICEIYTGKTGRSPAEVKALMDAETWMTGAEAVDNGFATAIGEPAACDAALARAQLRQCAAAAWCPCDCANCVAGNCVDCDNADCTSSDCVDCPMQGDDLASARAAMAARSASDYRNAFAV